MWNVHAAGRIYRWMDGVRLKVVTAIFGVVRVVSWHV